MSRIGKLPVEIPTGVTVNIDGNSVETKGPKGTLKKNFNSSVKFVSEGNTVVIEPANNSKLAKAMHGTARSVLASMVNGVKDGFEKKIEINGVGFQANLSGNILNLKLGYSHPINYSIPEGIVVTVDGGTKIGVVGADKQVVGQVCADIESYYPVEPYKGKGVRIVGKFYRRKEGKKTAK